MTDAKADDGLDDDEEEESGHSLARPPLYVLRAVTRCPECGCARHVDMLGCAALHDAGDLRPVGDFYFLHLIHNVPEPVLSLLEDRCPGYYLDRTEPEETPYLMNHCPCGHGLDDDFLHGDVGAAFWPATPEGYADFRLYRQSIDEAVPVECSWSLGGGEYLSFDQAEAWWAS